MQGLQRPLDASRAAYCALLFTEIYLACCLQADAFIQGLQTYLQQHALGTATSAELWAAVAAATGEPVGDWMQKWTYESGFPLLNVTMSGPEGLAVSVSQASAHCCTFVGVFGSEEQALPLPAAVKVEVYCQIFLASTYRCMFCCCVQTAAAAAGNSQIGGLLSLGAVGLSCVHFAVILGWLC